MAKERKYKVYFERFPSDNFNICDKKFFNNIDYFAYTKMGALQNFGMENPLDCGSFGKTKKEALNKSISESIERRSLLAYKNRDFKTALNVMDGSLKKVQYENYFFSKKNITDTTATACDTVPSRAVISAIAELIEKNSTFLFWYNNEGYEVDSNQTEKFVLRYGFREFKYKMYINLSFYPFIVAYVVLYKKELPLIIGTGSGTNYTNAIYKAMREANFLFKVESSMNIKAEILGIQVDKYTLAKEKSLKSVETRLKLKSYPKRSLSLHEINYKDKKQHLSILKMALSKYTNEVNIFPINLFNNRLTFKIYSPDLISYVPFKFNLRFDKKIYSRIKLRKEDILNFPELPIM
ncbi:YcaO-like family protein [Sporolactobacillus sp. CPB3-1]|uniref:YcaO-like family protein n=1 Tax=Sporolactobacillus mangiferae TaxID=2940498 RepID=A0ABT0MAB8_9BACL|nr:YcaO-like family protein [Sporolactobacillus mangiferae]MCL1631598.1 YcaO-like family protein [Sporolactobacillus mangiferae]